MKTLLFSILFCLSFFKSNAQLGNALQYTGDGSINGNGYPNFQYLQMPNGIVQSVSGAFTIEAWVKWTNPSVGPWQRIFDFGTGTSNFIFLTTANLSNQARFAIVSGATVEILDAAIPVPSGSWAHVAVSVDNTGTGRIFINGSLQGTAPFTLRPSSLGNTTANYLGKSQWLPDAYYNGIIDEFRISNVARYTANFTPQTTEFVADASTVALFHFNEGTGQQTFDVTASLAGTLGFSTAVEADLDPTWISTILPVKIESFTAQKQGSSVDLNWRAASTGDGGEFVIERSYGGRPFESIGTVDIVNTSGSFNYSFRDHAPAPAKNYYRLRILEKNAEPKFSPVVWVDMNSKGLYGLYPTATSTELYVTIPKESNLFIYNTNGSLVQKLNLPASKTINVQHLSKGLYYIRIEGSEQRLRFVKL